MTGKTLDSTYCSVGEPTARHAVREGSTRFGNVLVGVDGSPAGRDAIALGARLRHPEGRLALAHVSVTNSATYLSFDAERAMAESREMLERERAQAGVVAGVTGIASPSVGRGLHQLAEEYAADLMVVGSCSRGFSAACSSVMTPARRSTAPRARSLSRPTVTPKRQRASGRSGSRTTARPKPPQRWPLPATWLDATTPRFAR